jgi:hypothetical protein
MWRGAIWPRDSLLLAQKGGSCMERERERERRGSVGKQLRGSKSHYGIYPSTRNKYFFPSEVGEVSL